jgi:hypothetical protein
MAKLADQRSIATPGTKETPEALRSPPMAFWESPSAIFHAVPEFIWDMLNDKVRQPVAGLSQKKHSVPCRTGSAGANNRIWEAT